MFRTVTPPTPPPPEPPARDALVLQTAMVVFKPDGNKAIEGLVDVVAPDGYWLLGSPINRLVLHEVDDDGVPTATPITGRVWVDRANVLYINLLPPPPTEAT